MVYKECERAYERTMTRLEGVISEFYPLAEGEKTVEMEFSRADVQQAFRR